MRAVSVVRAAHPVRVFDLMVSDYHTVALANGVVVSNCDERCQGKTCGACDHADLKLRNTYIRAAISERHTDLSTVRPVDQRSQSLRIRARIHKPAAYRLVGNDHWRFAVRRAAFRAQNTLDLNASIAKRSIRFASDEAAYRDFTCGVDYLEFGLTRPISPSEVARFIEAMNTELDPWLAIGAFTRHPLNTTTLRSDVDLSLFELEIDAQPATVAQRLDRWDAAQHVGMKLKVNGGYFAPAFEEVNAKTYVEDLWLIRDGHRLKLRMLLRGRPSPYQIYAALMGRPSWLDAAAKPAVRLDAFIHLDRTQQDFLRAGCVDCGLLIPVNILDEPADLTHCPRCRDQHAGIAL